MSPAWGGEVEGGGDSSRFASSQSDGKDGTKDTVVVMVMSGEIAARSRGKQRLPPWTPAQLEPLLPGLP